MSTFLYRMKHLLGRNPRLVSRENNPFWKVLNNENMMTFPEHQILTRQSKIFTMGSCFAVEIRKAMRSQGMNVYPAYQNIQFDPERIKIGGLPTRENVNHYHTFSIKQEFERFAGHWSQQPDDFWQVQDRWFQGEHAYQDPYRKAVYGKTPEDLFTAISLLNQNIQNAIQVADAFIITLGLIEVWKDKKTGRFSCLNPGYAGGGGFEETSFHLSTFQENLDNLRATVEIINHNRPNSPIFFSVSPVPLGRTYTPKDVYISNMESKSLLRAAVGQLTQEYDNVIYFPSYEYCSFAKNVFKKDGRHVQPQIVEKLISFFIESFVEK